jgi:hypothetical protein
MFRGFPGTEVCAGPEAAGALLGDSAVVDIVGRAWLVQPIRMRAMTPSVVTIRI